MIEWVQNIKCVLALYILPSSIYCLIVSRLTVLVMPGRDDWQKCLFEISQMRDFHNCRLEVFITVSFTVTRLGYTTITLEDTLWDFH